MANTQMQPLNKPFKSREGLTRAGIASQIIHSILVWKTYRLSTRNDCQLVVNSLIRAYHIRLAADSKTKLPSSKEAIAERTTGRKPVIEHAIPVACIMRRLLEETVKGDFETAGELMSEVTEILETTALRAWVSKSEHDRLRQLGLELCMPDGHEFPWREKWARYTQAGIEIVE